jgi:hypothetical protein
VLDPEPGAAIKGGVNLAVRPVGMPVTVRTRLELKVLVAELVSWSDPLPPFKTLKLPVEAESVKVGAGRTVTDRAVVLA